MSFASHDATTLYTQLENLGMKIWVDGGWAADALLEKQTRPHKDFDIVLEMRHVPKLRAFLEAKGYKDVPQDDTREENFVLGDEEGRLIDVHAIVFDEKGNGIYGPKEKGVMFPAESLTGRGTIDGLVVRCISPEYLVKFHSGYELDAEDYHDVSLVCEKFGIPLPEDFKEFLGTEP